MLFVFKTDQLDEDDLEDFLKRLLDESETGLLTFWGLTHDIMMMTGLKIVLILQVCVVSYPIRH